MFEDLRRRLNLPTIPALNGIRAVSVLLVMLYHAKVPVSGPLGVLIFFVLSGFLITWLLLKESEKYGTISLKGFYRRRTVRIFPAFYCFWIVAVVLRAVERHSVPWPIAWSSFFYYANYYHGIVRPADQFIIHTWSLAVEEQFYLCWPLLFLAFHKNLKRLAWVTLGIIAIVIAHRTVLCLADTPYQYTRYTFDCRADSLLWGALFAILLRADYFRRAFAFVCKSPWFAVVTAVFIAVIAHGRFGDVVGLTILPPAAGLLICQLVAHSSSRGWRWLDSRPVAYLGIISYPLYLYHGLGVAVISRYPVNRVVDIVVLLIVAVAIASASYYFVERPLQRFKSPKARRAAVA